MATGRRAAGRGGGEEGGVEEDEGGPQDLDWQVKGQGGGKQRHHTHTQTLRGI